MYVSRKNGVARGEIVPQSLVDTVHAPAITAFEVSKRASH
jgi:hypothetical protein